MDTAHSLHASRRRHHVDRAARRQTLAPPAGRQTQKNLRHLPALHRGENDR